MARDKVTKKYLDVANIDLAGFPTALKNLTAAEINQLENINVTTISTTQWGYLGGFDQDLQQADSPAFAGVTINGNIIVTGNVDGTDIAALKSDVDGFPDELKNLTPTEIAELENIGATTITAGQWAYLGNMDQEVITSSDVTFGIATLGHIKLLERSSDPAEPGEGEVIIWMSDGTGKGDDGDIMIASKAGGTTNFGTLFDHSAGAAW